MRGLMKILHFMIHVILECITMNMMPQETFFNLYSEMGRLKKWKNLSQNLFVVVQEAAICGMRSRQEIE